MVFKVFLLWYSKVTVDLRPNDILLLPPRIDVIDLIFLYRFLITE
jgi:hypothetical protein